MRVTRGAFAPAVWTARAGALLAAILAWAFLLSTGTPVHAAEGLPAARDLAADGAAARPRKVPIVLFFNRADCPYCERALRQFLVPMQRDPAFAARAVFRQVEIDTLDPLVDFEGRASSHRDFAARFNIRFTPTIWFVDAQGKSLVEPIVGLRTPDFYGWYLEQAIADAQAKLDGRAVAGAAQVPAPAASSAAPVLGTPVRRP